MRRLDTWTAITSAVTLVWVLTFVGAIFVDPDLKSLAELATTVMTAVIAAFAANKVSERTGIRRRNGNGAREEGRDDS